MELTDAGRKVLGDRNGVFDVRYHNGPIMSPMGKDRTSVPSERWHIFVAK